MSSIYDNPNQIVRGAYEIGLVASIFEKKGGKIVVNQDGGPIVDTNKVYYDVRAGKLDVSHNGRELVSTVGRIRNSVLNTSLKIEAA
jgi:hypothetical protein